MENASKALLIAASILIVIILIAFGMQTLNSTKETQDSVKTTMDATAKASFNNKFTAYFGNKSVAQAKALVDVIIANNATNDNKVDVTINSALYKNTDSDFTSKLWSAVSALTGIVNITGNAPNGIITEIIISYPTTTTTT